MDPTMLVLKVKHSNSLSLLTKNGKDQMNNHNKVSIKIKYKKYLK